MNVRFVTVGGSLAALLLLGNLLSAQDSASPATPNPATAGAQAGAAATPLSDAWVGTYSGELEIFDATGKAAGKTNMQVEIGAAESGAPRPFRILYGEPGKAPVRDYQLVATGEASNHFLNDEKSGILIDTYLIGDTLYSQFEVGGSRVDTRFQLTGDQLRSEMVTYGVTAQRDTRPSFDSSFIVRAFTLQGVQKALLTRAPATPSKH